MATLAARLRITKALLISNLVSIVLFGLRVIATHNTYYWFLFWNLLLAWMPAIFAILLRRQLKRKSWQEPLPILLTFLWLGFLPNSFYLMSDLIHLQNTGDIGVLFDVVLFLSCIWNGVVAGMLSLVWVHKVLLQKTRSVIAAGIVGAVLAMTSFAIYLGRTLRWNTWDVLVNPAGILFDVSERVINPLEHPQVLVTTLTFFVLLGSMYMVIWQFVCASDQRTSARD
ncbi:MAG TPA: DUF1361 domain-containing protein [Candidatus Limnocylindrales bacterium]|nr:DUF1361 domain-containing protein [Candidatus Limnocylindrales bacterium]